MSGGSERCVPELSDSQRGITRKAGRLGGILELGEVSLDGCELSNQESESDMFVAWGDKAMPWRDKVPFPINLSGGRWGEGIDL